MTAAPSRDGPVVCGYHRGQESDEPPRRRLAGSGHSRARWMSIWSSPARPVSDERSRAPGCSAPGHGGRRPTDRESDHEPNFRNATEPGRYAAARGVAPLRAPGAGRRGRRRDRRGAGGTRIRSPPHYTLRLPGPGGRPGRSQAALGPDALAGPGDGRRLVARRPGQENESPSGVLADGVRLASLRDPAEWLGSISDRDRRPQHTLPAHPLPPPERNADHHHARLARLGDRVPQDPRATDESRGPDRKSVVEGTRVDLRGDDGDG